MESQSAKVIPWSGKTGRAKEDEGPTVTREAGFGPIDDVLIVMSDDQLDALAATFLMSPVRRAMTFEAYLAVKGFARDAE